MVTESTTVTETAGQFGIHPLRSCSRLTYATCYRVAYGVVYATVFLAKSIPQNNPIVQGLVDGGRAAVQAVNEQKGQTATVVQALPA